MQVGLFIPCYVDQFYPQVGIATVKLLERFGAQVVYPREQTCCGQPLANVGLTADAVPLARRFVDLFADFDYIVGPSGSCVSMIRNHYADLVGEMPAFARVQQKTFELCEFLFDVLEIRELAGKFPHQVGIHQGCHGLRELRVASSSETVGTSFNKMRTLLESLDGIQISELDRVDECCGFGGTFAVSEEAVSAMMGRDRLQDHRQAGTKVLTSGDMSCLMHLAGLARRDATAMRVMHVAEVFVEASGGK